VERIGAIDAVNPALRKTERLSRQHWTLVWLKAHPGWSGEGIMVAEQGRNAQLLLPELAMEIRVPMKQGMVLDESMALELTGVDLPQLDAHFRLAK